LSNSFIQTVFALSGLNDKLPKRVELRFLLNSAKFEPSKDVEASLGAVVCERTRLKGEVGKQQATGIGEFETIPAQLALVSIGYKGLPLRGIEHLFDDERGVIHHQHGHVDPANESIGALYAVGWLKRGPYGIIGTNIADAKETVSTILSDIENGFLTRMDSSAASLDELLQQRSVTVVNWEGYRRIEAQEHERRRSEEQPREKIVNLEELIAIATS
jgi:NADPH-dependent glutamate synthase beta subunit-like oxidoreductase